MAIAPQEVIERIAAGHGILDRLLIDLGHKPETKLRAAAKKVVDARYDHAGTWDDLKESIAELADVLESDTGGGS